MSLKPLWEVQRKAVDWALARPATMLNMDMGTGKTRTSIEVASRLGARRVLVVAPRSVLPVWGVEVPKFSPGVAPEVLVLSSGSSTQRRDRLREFLSAPGDSPRWVVVNYEIIWREPIRAELAQSWDLMILDESHRAKSYNSKTSRACHSIGKRARRRLCLSGTPMANSPLDVFGQYRFLDDSIFGKSWARFTDEFAIRGGPERRFIVGHKNLDRLGQLFNSIAFTCTKADIAGEVDLGAEPTFEYRFGELDPKARKVYRDLEQDFVAEWSEGLVVPQNVLVRLLRFQQITSGFVEVVDEFGENPRIQDLPDRKLQLFRELLEDLPPQEPIVVFYKFREDLRKIRDNAGGRAVYEISGDRLELEEWNRDPTGLVAVQYRAGSEGISLVHSSYCIFYSGTFSLAESRQAQARLHRPGQTRPVTFFHLVLEKTIDQTIVETLEDKSDLVQRVMSTGRV